MCLIILISFKLFQYSKGNSFAETFFSSLLLACQTKEPLEIKSDFTGTCMALLHKKINISLGWVLFHICFTFIPVIVKSVVLAISYLISIDCKCALGWP